MILLQREEFFPFSNAERLLLQMDEKEKNSSL